MSECPYCTNAFEVNDTCHDEFRMWQGLVGPYYIPTIEDGVLTWTNTGGLPNPNPINIIGAQGNGLYIGGIAETTGDLPETAENGVTWLVGEDEPYEGYVYLNGSWVDIGAVTPGPTGPQGIPGAGVPSGGTTGQVLQKASNTDYQTEWADPASGGDPPGTMLPLMDGTAAVGTARSYAREDHVHPQDSEIAELKTSINGKVSDTGDTMTGDLIIDGGYFVPKSSNLTNGTAVASNTQGNGRVQFKDSLGNALGIIYPYFRTDGKQGIRLLADRFIGSTEYVASLELGVASDGTKYVELPNSTDIAFLKALGLYSVEIETTASNIATASSGYSIQTATYVRWGHVAMVYLGIKRTNGVSSDTSLQPCTLVSGKRPSIEAAVTSRNNAVKTAYFSSGGTLNTYQTWEAGATFYFTSTFIVP